VPVLSGFESYLLGVGIVCIVIDVCGHTRWLVVSNMHIRDGTYQIQISR
jgi:hypothetical protein